MKPLETGLSPFTTYINAVGADRIRVIAEQRDRRDNPDALAWWCYQAAFTGLRAALAAPTPDAALERMVAEAPQKMGQHYREFAEGIQRLLARGRLTLVRTGAGSWEAEGLHVNITHCLGARRADGTTTCVFPYFKKDPLTSSVAAGMVRLVELGVPTILPGAAPAVLEVRTGKLYRPHHRRNVNTLDAWLHVEAGAYVDHWNRGTAAA